MALIEDLAQTIKGIIRRIENLEKGSQIKKTKVPSDGYFVPKVLSSDPSDPVNNEVWINSTTNQLKWNKNGSIKTVTLS